LNDLHISSGYISTPAMFSLDQYRAARDAAAFQDRSARARLRLTGADRREYLQGLLTNDVVALGAGQGSYAALLTAQGRMIADMFIVETGDAVLIDLEPALGDKVCAHLERFIFSEDVQVANVTAETAQIGVFGPGAAALIASVLADGCRAEDLERLPVLASRQVQRDGSPLLIVRRDDLGVAGFDLVGSREDAPALIAALRDAGALSFGDDVAEVLRVEYGRPRFQQDMSEDTIPLEAGIEDRAISMTKGCYVGQEIIVRVLHRGHGRVAKKLVGLTLDPAAAVPAHGDRVRAGADDRDVGVVTSAVSSPAAGAPLALGYVHRDFVDEGTSVTIDSGGARAAATVRRLPFAAAGWTPAPVATDR
jgi:folate-binding protein YgfZ